MVNIGYSSSNTISNYSIDEVGQSEPLFSLMAQSITDLVASGAIELLLIWAYATKIIELFFEVRTFTGILVLIFLTRILGLHEVEVFGFLFLKLAMVMRL